MAEWSQLPRELVDLVARHLESDTDLLRFRSVCSSWRSSVSPKPPPAPSRFPILPNDGISDTTWGFYLSKRAIFRIGLPESHQRTSSSTSDGWLIKLERDVSHRMHLLNPLSCSESKPLPPNFPRLFDSSHFRVSELGHEYTLQYINYRPFATSIGESGNLYMEKVAFFPIPNTEGIDSFVLLTIHVSGKLAMFKSGDKRWSIIDDLPSPYDDVIFYDGRFYAVDSTGRTVVVMFGPRPTVNVVAHSVFGGDKKFLVESSSELLLVDMYLSVGPNDELDHDEGVEFYDDLEYFLSERTVRFKVFQLDGSRRKWTEVRNLGDQMLFLGDNCTFSASASDFSGCKGNCIFFTDHFFYSNREEDGGLKNRGTGVFDLDSGSIGPLACCSGYSDLFWPPPSWVATTSTIEKS